MDEEELGGNPSLGDLTLAREGRWSVGGPERGGVGEKLTGAGMVGRECESVAAKEVLEERGDRVGEKEKWQASRGKGGGEVYAGGDER